ncbi:MULTISPECIES: LysR family transcriptional regulator [Bradyrhizobium]|uniref:LysR family transcriptional regulator n=1 Tax=Bradyrhizobium TaxID=374 RepID=UPI001EDA0789|nr:LysR family transcriptional regulator [Bradyrhizobium zhengyangense]MCG2641493.1 LysR family transcriptional regulator [Bradyrhizobium zhengyangense]
MIGSSHEMCIFKRVIERGSFAGAAEDVGLSPSAVSKLITRLELRLGVRLINRTTRRLALTQEGEIYLERSRDILRAIEAVEAEIATTRVSPRGQLRVHAFPTFAVDHLSPALPDFLARYPRITFDFLITNRSVDLIDDNIDVALRVGQLTDSTSVACKIVNLTQVVCASPKYLARHGRPVQPSDLRRHACLTLSHFPGANKWPFRADGKRVEVEVKGPVVADSAHMLLRLAIEGVGIIRFGDNIVARAIQEGLLEPLLQDLQEPENFPLWALLPPGRQRTPKVRAFLDFLTERFGGAPWRSMQ